MVEVVLVAAVSGAVAWGVDGAVAMLQIQCGVGGGAAG